MLKYIGDGSFIPGVPARDLGDVEVKLIADAMNQADLAEVLVQSGLYQIVEKKSVIRGRENKILQPEAENKDAK